MCAHARVPIARTHETEYTLPRLMADVLVKKKKRRTIFVKSYIFKVVVEEDFFEDGRKAYHAFSPVLKGCHTAKRKNDG